MEVFFNEYLKVEVLDSGEFKSLKFENPYVPILFESIFTKIYDKVKKDQRGELNSIINDCKNETNTSLYNIFRCSKCYDILIIKDKKNNYEIKCSNCEKEFKEIDPRSAIMTIFSDFLCSVCKTKIFLYRQNFKCNKCKCLVCQNCKINHLKK